MKILIIILFLSITSSPVIAGSPDAETCKRIWSRIHDINERMRAGYRAKYGEYLKEQLRELHKDGYKCRRKYGSTIR